MNKFKTVILNFKNIYKHYSFDEINGVSKRLFQNYGKKKILNIPNFWLLTCMYMLYTGNAHFHYIFSPSL